MFKLTQTCQMPVKRKARKQDIEREKGGRRNKWKQLKEITSEQEVKTASERLHCLHLSENQTSRRVGGGGGEWGEWTFLSLGSYEPSRKMVFS